jgi:hypothetical protein
VDLNAIYQVVRTVAVTRELISYYGLAHRYALLTGGTPPAEHVDWDRALWEINERLLAADLKAPPIGALVILSRHPGPSDAFWNGATNTPPRPRAVSDGLWRRIVAEVHDYDWPPTLP